MKVAVNYSSASAELLRSGEITIDRFKCPARPDMVQQAGEIAPLYVHFPLRAGSGNGLVINTETTKSAEWDAIEAMMEATRTPMINLHLAPKTSDDPKIPPDTSNKTHLRLITERLMRDVEAVVERFGADRVVVENVTHGRGEHPRPALLPATITRVVKETGCGLLLDLSHAWLAARFLGMDARTYISALPVHRLCEIHVSGIQPFVGRWVELAHLAGMDQEVIAELQGQPVDHLPMTESDWDLLRWALDQIAHDRWSRPWIVTLEYGGVGWLFEAVTDKHLLARQIPQLFSMVKDAGPVTSPSTVLP